MRPRDVPVKYQKLYERAMSGKSRKAAMRYFCLECVGWNASEVVQCTAKGCSLYPYRLQGLKTRSEGAPQGVLSASRSDAAGQDGTLVPGNA